MFPVQPTICPTSFLSYIVNVDCIAGDFTHRPQIDHLAVAIQEGMLRSVRCIRAAYNLPIGINRSGIAILTTQRSQVRHLAVAVEEGVSSPIGCFGIAYNLAGIVDRIVTWRLGLRRSKEISIG